MTSVRNPNPPRKRWLLSLFLFALLIFLSYYSISNPMRDKEKSFVDAEEVPISRITKGYFDNEFERILIRDNKVFATTKEGKVLRSYRGSRDSISDLKWNDPDNTTVVEIEDREAANMFVAILPDLLFF